MGRGNRLDQIMCNSEIHHGASSIGCTHVAVSVIVASLADLRVEYLLKEYQQLTRKDGVAARGFTAELSQFS